MAARAGQSYINLQEVPPVSRDEKLTLLIALIAFARSGSATQTHVVSRIEALADELGLDITDRLFSHELMGLVDRALSGRTS